MMLRECSQNFNRALAKSISFKVKWISFIKPLRTQTSQKGNEKSGASISSEKVKFSKCKEWEGYGHFQVECLTFLKK